MMGVDSLLKEVEEKRSRALDALEEEFKAKREEIGKRTASESSYIAEAAMKEAGDLSQKETTRVLGAAKLQAKKAMFDAIEALLENNISLLKEELATYAESPAYKQLLSKMAAYAAKRLGGKVVVVCREEDAAGLKAAGVKIASSDLNSIGGFRAESSDGTLEMDLTFEEILRSREDEVRSAILGKE